jgi:hypothetical protein
MLMLRRVLLDGRLAMFLPVPQAGFVLLAKVRLLAAVEVKI